MTESGCTSRGLHVLFANTRDMLGSDVAVHQLLARHLAGNGVRITFTVNQSARHLAAMRAALAGDPGVRILQCSLGRPLERANNRRRHALSGLRNLSAIPTVARLATYIRRQQVDVLHATDRPRDALLCTVLGRLTGRPSVIQMHSNYVGCSRATRWAFQHCTRVFAVSHYIGRSLEEAGLLHERLDIIHNIVDPEYFRPSEAARGAIRTRFGIPLDAPLIGLVGRLNPFKGHEDLLAAFAVAGRRLAGAHLVIAGATDGDSVPYVDMLGARIHQLGLVGRVHFTGYQRDTRPVYADIDVLAVPSWDEPFGLVVTEAMAMGVPVVAYRSGGIPEIIDSGQEGVLVGSRNVADLGAALVSLVSDPRLRARMGAAGRQRVLTQFNPQRQVDEVLAAYRRISHQQQRTSTCAPFT